jgi:hypothetical protein
MKINPHEINLKSFLKQQNFFPTKFNTFTVYNLLNFLSLTCIKHIHFMYSNTLYMHFLVTYQFRPKCFISWFTDLLTLELLWNQKVKGSFLLLIKDLGTGLK